MKLFGFHISKVDWKRYYMDAEADRRRLKDKYEEAYNHAWYLERLQFFNHEMYWEMSRYACSCCGLFEAVRLYLRGITCDKEKLEQHISDLLETQRGARWTHDEMMEIMSLSDKIDRKKIEKIKEIIRI